MHLGVREDDEINLRMFLSVVYIISKVVLIRLSRRREINP